MRNRVVTRTVRNGSVVIGGVRYRPRETHMKYDGRCDGTRFLFGRYPKPGLPGEWEPLVSICTTEKHHRSGNDKDAFAGPDIVDGTMPWLFWEAETA
jgi:hypothetical protein